MLTPNHLTGLRLVLTPLFFLLFYLAIYRPFPNPLLPSWLSFPLLGLLYLVAELTDLLDGFWARRSKLVTNLGKILDPFADVFWRLTIFYCLTVASVMPILAFMLILWRELAMLFVRHLVQAYGNQAFAASWAGKLKAVLYAVSSCYWLAILLTAGLWQPPAYVLQLGQWFFWLAALASLGSFALYLRQIVIFWRKKSG